MELSPKCLDKSSIRECDHPVIPEFLGKVLRIFGLFPRSVPRSSHSCVKRSVYRYGWFVWAGLLGLVLGIVTLLQIVGYFRKYFDLLTDLEFFTLIAFEYRVVVMSQAPYAIACMLFISRSLEREIHNSTILLKETLNKSVLARLRKVSIIIILWSFCCIVIGVVTKSVRTVMISDEGTTDWHTKIGYFTNVLQVPAVVHMGVYGFGAIMSSCSEYLPLAVLMILAVHYGSAFNHLGKILTKEISITPEDLRATFCTYFRFVRHVEKVGWLFGPILLMVCFRDMIAWAAVNGTLLHVEKRNWSVRGNFTRSADEDVNYERRMDIVVTLLAMGAMMNGLLRILVFCWMHNKAQKAHDSLRTLAFTSTESNVITECHKISGHLKSSDGALSVCGFFILTKDYVVAFAGLAVTYFIVIYQTRDSRKDMEEMKEILSKQEHVIRQLVNGTELNGSLTD